MITCINMYSANTFHNTSCTCTCSISCTCTLMSCTIMMYIVIVSCHVLSLISHIPTVKTAIQSTTESSMLQTCAEHVHIYSLYTHVYMYLFVCLFVCVFVCPHLVVVWLDATYKVRLSLLQSVHQSYKGGVELGTHSLGRPPAGRGGRGGGCQGLQFGCSWGPGLSLLKEWRGHTCVVHVHVYCVVHARHMYTTLNVHVGDIS